MSRITALAVALAAAGAFAQEQRPEQEVLVSGEVEHGGYGGPEMRFTTIRGDGAVFVGGRGGWVINHAFVIGGAGYGMVTRAAAPDIAFPGVRHDMTFGYGGPFIEAIVLPHRVWHVSVASLFGVGGISYVDNAAQNGITRDSTAVFVWEPSATLEINVFKFMRVDFGASYRLVRGADLPGLTNSDMSGFSGLLAFKFGKF